MLKSRLRNRRRKKQLTVSSRSHSGSTYSESVQLVCQFATHEQRTVNVTDDLQGTYDEIIDVFWIEAEAGENLPTVSTGWVLVDSDDVRYEVRRTKKMGGEEDRLMVETKRLNWPV